MSVINKIPFLETLLNNLTADNLKTLKNCIDGKGPAPIFRTLKPISENKLTPSDKGIKPILLEVNKQVAQPIYKGYLVYNDNYCVVISYSSETAPLITIVQINMSDYSYTILSYSCSILELRSELNDRLVEAGEAVKVGADDILSGAQTAGKVLMADGAGGAEWGDSIPDVIQNNDTVKRFEKVYIDSFDDLPANVQAAINAHFDDTTYTITLSTNEANNYIFSKFAEYVNIQHADLSSFGKFKYSDKGESGINVTARGIPVAYYDLMASFTGGTFVYFNYNNLNKFSYIFQGTEYALEYDLQIIVNSTKESIYLAIKSIIIKDLLANLGYQIIYSKETIEARIAVSAGVKLYKHNLRMTAKYSISGGSISSHSITFPYLSNKPDAFTNSDIYFAGRAYTAKAEYSGDTLYMYIGPTYDASSSARPYIISDFMNTSFMRFGSSYPGSSYIFIEGYEKDKIDIATGEILSRTNIVSDVSDVSFTDTVTEL